MRGDPFAAQLQGLLADGGVAARDAFGLHAAALRERRRFAKARLRRAGVATGAPKGADDGGLHVWADLRPFLSRHGNGDGDRDGGGAARRIEGAATREREDEARRRRGGGGIDSRRRGSG